MSNFGTILKYELKKLVQNRASIIAIFGCAAFMLGVTFLNYLVISPQEQYVYEQEQSLDGSPIDDALLSDIAEEAREYGSLIRIPRDSLYHYISENLYRMLIDYTDVEGVSDLASGESLTAENLYQTREDVMTYLYDYFCLSDAEKDYWSKQRQAIKKPYVWHSNYSVYLIVRNFYSVSVMYAMIAGICLSGVYAGEKSLRTDALTYCTKYGRNKLSLAKFVAGEIYSLTVGMILLIAMNIGNIVFNGFRGSQSCWQLITLFSDYPYTIGKMLLIYLGIYALSCLLIGATVMFLSLVLQNMVAVAGFFCFATVLDMFISVQPRFRYVAQLRYLTPVQILINSTITDPRLLKVGNHFLTAFWEAAILYVLLTCLIFAMTMIVYRRRDTV